MFELTGKVALVTGAASGIGSALVKQFLINGLKGVAMLDVDVVRGRLLYNEVTAEFGKERAIFLKVDVSDKGQLEEAFKTTVRTYNQIDIVCNNAGIINEVDWEKCIAVNVTGLITGSFLASEKYLAKCRGGDEGVILNTASIAGLTPLIEVPTYDATKAAVICFTRALGDKSRYQATNIRVIGICPGLTNTAMPNKLTKHQVPEPYCSKFIETMKTLVTQESEDVAKIAMDLIKDSPSGSVWVAQDKTCTPVEFPQFSL